MERHDQVVLVAGAGSSAPGWSIGKATAVLMAQSGYRVIALDSDLQAAEETCHEIAKAGGSGMPMQGDITSQAQMEHVVKTATTSLGNISSFIANAGIGKLGGLAQTSTQDLKNIQATNVEGLMRLSKLLIPGMLAQGKGSIVSVASVAGMRYIGYPHLAYSVTKAAMIHMTRMIAQEYAHRQIRANTVIPGLIDTPRIQKNVGSAFSAANDPKEVHDKRSRQVPMQRMGSAWEVAQAIMFLASDNASYITGTELVVDGGLIGKFN